MVRLWNEYGRRCSACVRVCVDVSIDRFDSIQMIECFVLFCAGASSTPPLPCMLCISLCSFLCPTGFVCGIKSECLNVTCL